ncbi:MAG: CCA tRNA nucleotidyltransferase [Pseudomonadota bacterium]
MQETSEKIKASFDWVREPRILKIINALIEFDLAKEGTSRGKGAKGEEVGRAAHADVVRFVGGCVRDSFLGLSPKDIDAATRLHPEETIAALEQAGISAHPTGLSHGTITAAYDDAVVEITTLRSDVSTDGRRAVVAFTDDWTLDAKRRDFTINALYVSPQLSVFDPVGGMDDLASGTVRFIGNPEQRIKEDYLRILRFFRFSARFAANGFDATGLSACRRLKDGLSQLSAERIGAEMLALLSLPKATDALEVMAEAGILQAIYPHRAELSVGAALKDRQPDVPAAVMLAALWGEAGSDLMSAWRLSNDDNARRKMAVAAGSAVRPNMTPADVRACVYRLGRMAFNDGLLLAEARGVMTHEIVRAYADIAVAHAPPVFPLSGKDLLALGIESGPRIGEILRAVERRWVEEDFPGKDRLREILNEEIRK